MTDVQKKKIGALLESGMNMRQIQQALDIDREELVNALGEMKRNDELPTIRKTAEEKVIEAYHRGERNPYEIAEKLGISVNSVRSFFGWNKLHKGKKTRNWIHCDRTNAIIKDLQEGKLSQVEIAKKHDVSRQYITKIKRKMEKWNEN